MRGWGSRRLRGGAAVPCVRPSRLRSGAPPRRAGTCGSAVLATLRWFVPAERHRGYCSLGIKITPPQNHNPKSRFHPRSSRLKAFDRTVFQPSPLASSDGGEGKGVGMIWPRWAGADGCAG